MTDECQHTFIQQFSTIYARTDWTFLEETGEYEPDEVPCSKVLEEETTRWVCAECEKEVSPEEAESFRSVTVLADA